MPLDQPAERLFNAPVEKHSIRESAPKTIVSTPSPKPRHRKSISPGRPIKDSTQSESKPQPEPDKLSPSVSQAPPVWKSKGADKAPPVEGIEKLPWKIDPEGLQKKTDTFELLTNSAWRGTDYYYILGRKIVQPYYIGAPLKKEPDDLVYINYAEQAINRTHPQLHKKMVMPNAFRLYLDTGAARMKADTAIFSGVKAEALNTLINPFYFRRYEVTNLEYKEFLLWVAQQHGFPDYRTAKPSELKEKQAFSYTFRNPAAAALKGWKSNTIDVFPDTTVFTKDFIYSYSEPLTKYYIQHAAYDKYPVVGITYWQAMAYLDWLTSRYQAYFDKNNIPYTIQFSLPNDIEWEMAASLQNWMGNMEIPTYNVVADNNWLTDLVICSSIKNEKENTLSRLLVGDVTLSRDYIEDVYFYTGPADLREKWAYHKYNTKQGAIHLSLDEISWMDGNVSEWMQESYTEYYLPMYSLHHRLMLQSGHPEDQLTAAIEDYYNKRNNPRGHLVRGGNFWDERYSIISNKNLAGTMLKRFVSPDEAHSTIGFRYVVRITRKE